MPDTQRAEQLLALFTSPECAEGIVGDLSEAAATKGSLSFWRDVLTTTAALSAVTVDRAPFATLRHAASALAGLVSFAMLGVASVALFPQLLGSVVAWALMSLIWWSGAHYSGASVVRSGEARGLAACVGIAIAAEALVLWFGLTSSTTPNIATLASAALAPALMLVGATTQRTRMIARDALAVEPQV